MNAGKRKALVVGGGVAGLSAAWWLAATGWRVTLVERAPDLRADGYMLGLSGPGYEVARRMELLPRLRECERHIEDNLYLARDGSELLRINYHDFLKGLEWITLARPDLATALYEAIRTNPDVDIRFATEVETFRDEGDAVSVRLRDGSAFSVDLLIGADGVRSATRSALFGESADHLVPLGYRMAAYQVSDPQGLGNDFLSYAEPGRMVEYYRLPQDKIAALHIWCDEDASFVSMERRKQLLGEAFAGAHPDVIRRIALLGEQDDVLLDGLVMVDLPSWHKGRCLLLGDAAHCLTLVSGQGAGMAMTSACVLAEELARGDIAEALERHEARLRPTITTLQVRSRSTARWFVPRTDRAFAFRNAIMRWMPKWLLNRYFQRGIRSEVLAASSLRIEN